MLSSSNYHGNLNRAELLFKVFKYTEWEKERGKDQPFTFCIIGQSVVGIADNFPENYKINERIILPKQIKKLEEIGDAEVLYICHTEFERIETILAYVSSFDILTVGEKDGMSHKGVMVNIFESNGEIVFEINDKAEKNSSVDLHAHLFKIANVIR